MRKGAKPKEMEAEELWTRAAEYFAWCDRHPWKTEKTRVKKSGRGKGDREVETTPVSRPYSITGLCSFLDIVLDTWLNMKQRAVREHNEVADVIARVEQIIETNQFEGAVVGAYNACIIARKLGLSEKSEVSGFSPVALNITVMKTEAELKSSEEDIDD